MNLHDFFTIEFEKFHHSDSGHVCRAVLTEAEGHMLDATIRSVVLKALHLFMEKLRAEERQKICHELLKTDVLTCLKILKNDQRRGRRGRHGNAAGYPRTGGVVGPADGGVARA
jgi:hypothetical protein